MPSEEIVDEFNPIVQELRDRFENKYLEDEGLEGYEFDAMRVYNRSWKRPYVCTLAADVLSGRWGMGSTQEEVSNSLGIRDRTWLSVALRHGEMTMDNFTRLRCWPRRPKDWEPDIIRLSRDMHRSGFIAVARYLAGFVKDRPTLAPERLDELNFELVTEIPSVLSTFQSARWRNDATLSAEMVRRVSQDERRNVAPAWLKRSDRDAVLADTRRLNTDPAVAFKHLCELQDNWLDVFVVAYAIVGSLPWRQE